MEMNVLDTRDMNELGRELQEARKSRGLTQEQAAEAIGVARTTLTAIEKGQRKIRPGELIQLARAYGRQVSDFVRPRPAIMPLQVQFRGPYRPTEEEQVQAASSVEELKGLCRDYLELEEITEARLPRKYPPELKISSSRLEAAAEVAANSERQRLGLGDGPIPQIRDLLEQEVGLRIFYLPLKPSKLSEIYLYDDVLGGCFAVNRSHPEERRRWSLAHGYAHFLAHRRRPTIFLESGYQRLPSSELFADYFALHFLMPASAIKRQVHDLLQAKGKLTLRDLLPLAHYYGVSVAAFARRLEDLKLVRSGMWDDLRDRGLKVREAQRSLELPPVPARDDMLPVRYQYLAMESFQRELISEGQLAHFLRVDRLEARQVVETLRQHSSEITDNTPIKLDLAQSLEV